MRLTNAFANHGLSRAVIHVASALRVPSPFSRSVPSSAVAFDCAIGAMSAFLREALRDLAEVVDLDAPHVAHRLAAVDGLDPLVQERGGEAAEVLLLPLLGLVIVALRALDLHAEEDARRVAGEILRAPARSGASSSRRR